MAKDDRKAATQAKVLDAAVAQFGCYGLDGTTVQAIADVAGVSTGAVHWHFGTKSGLYAEAARVASEHFLHAMRHDEDGHRIPFAGLAQRWITRLEDNTAAARLVRSVVGHRHRALEEVARRVNDLFVDFWCDWLRQRSPPPETHSTSVLGTLIVASLTGLVATGHSQSGMVEQLLDRLALAIEDFGPSDEHRAMRT